MNEANAKKLLFMVADVLDELGATYLLTSGTLLGAVREKGFIKIDRDVDLSMLYENLLPIAKDAAYRLRKRGIRVEIIDHRHMRPWNGGVYALKFHGYKERGDISGFMKIQGKRAIPSHIGDFWIVRSARFMEELGEIEFYERMFKAPKDVDGYLTETYGDWRTPHKKFHNVSKPTCRKSESWLKE